MTLALYLIGLRPKLLRALTRTPTPALALGHAPARAKFIMLSGGLSLVKVLSGCRLSLVLRVAHARLDRRLA